MSEIADYNQAQPGVLPKICVALNELFDARLPNAESKVWHGHPVWFIDGNPVAGYSVKKSGVQVLFWSGQSFKTPGLTPLGKFKAAAFAVAELEDAQHPKLGAWLAEAIQIQWDYKNLAKKRRLELLVDLGN